MRIAVSATGPVKDSLVDERFGRCSCFIVFDEKTNAVEVINNDGVAAAEGAGVKSAALLLQNRVDVVLTGRVGPKAMHALTAGGVSVYIGVEGTAADTLVQYHNGSLTPLGAPNAGSHAGKKKLEPAP